MQTTFLKLKTSNFGTLYFRECGKLLTCTSDMGEFVLTKELTDDAPCEVTALYSWEGVLVTKKAKLKVECVERVECVYKRKAKPVDEALGGFKFKDEVFRTFSEVQYEARDEVEVMLDEAIAEAEDEELEEAYCEGALVGIA